MAATSPAGSQPRPASPRRIWLCADDYGISLSVNAAIRDLIVRRRLNATSVMVAAPSFDQAQANALDMLNAGAGRRVAIGLHVTLTAPFRPLSHDFYPLSNGGFPSLREMMARSAVRLLLQRPLIAEITAQLAAFFDVFGRAPDFVDGHQHVHLFPQVREAVLDAVKTYAPHAWLRQCGRAGVRAWSRADSKGIVLDALSRKFRRRADEFGIVTNPAFAGTYDFGATDQPDYLALFGAFFDGLPSGGLVMCHPGAVDAELTRLDPLTGLREREYAFLAGDEFPALLKSHSVTLA